MTIRKMTLKDYPVVSGMMEALHRLHVENRPDLFTQAMCQNFQEKYEEMIQDDTCILLLAEENGLPLGFCILYIQEPRGIMLQKSAHMDDLFVAENARRKGVAKKLYREAQLRARAAGAAHMTLKVWAFNEPAIAFYRSMGMKVRSYFLEKEL